MISLRSKVLDQGEFDILDNMYIILKKWILETLKYSCDFQSTMLPLNVKIIFFEIFSLSLKLCYFPSGQKINMVIRFTTRAPECTTHYRLCAQYLSVDPQYLLRTLLGCFSGLLIGMDGTNEYISRVDAKISQITELYCSINSGLPWKRW